MACLGCGAEIAPGKRWCDECASLWNREIVPTAVAPAPSPAFASPSAPAPAFAVPPPPLAPALPPAFTPPPAPAPAATPFAPPASRAPATDAQPAPAPVAAPAWAAPVAADPRLGPYTPDLLPYLPPAPSGRGRGRGRGRNRTGNAIAIGAVVVVLIAAGIGVLLLAHRGGAKPAANVTTNTDTTTLPATATGAGAPLGYTTFVDKTDHFRIATPTSWQEVDPASPAARQKIEQIVESDPALAADFGNGATIPATIKFLAVDVNPLGFSPNVNIVVEPAVGLRDARLPDALTGIRNEYARMGLTVRRVAYVRLAGHRALRVALSVPSQGLGGETAMVQDLVAANDSLYVITRTGTNPDLARIVATFRVS